MKLQELLSRVEGLRSTGQNRWIARCPSHDDKTPSMTIRDAGDRVLIHCFAGCSVHDIVSAVGLELTDLFPERPKHHNEPIKHRFMPQEVLKCLSGETMFLTLCANDMAKGEQLSDRDRERLGVAHRRLANAAKAAGI